MSPSSFKSMYQNFNWRFWKDDGMRNEDDIKETDPHYREMLKVIILHLTYKKIYFAWNLLMSNVDSTPMPQIVGIWLPFSFLSSCHLSLYTRPIRLCHGKYFVIPESAMFKFLPFRWGFLISLLLAVVSILFFGALYAITGLGFIIQPFIQVNLLVLEDYIIVQQTSR